MSEYLPYGRFKWLNQKEIDKFDVYVNVNSICESSLIEYILEVND